MYRMGTEDERIRSSGISMMTDEEYHCNNCEKEKCKGECWTADDIDMKMFIEGIDFIETKEE